jgi:hypothetical protein
MVPNGALWIMVIAMISIGLCLLWAYTWSCRVICPSETSGSFSHHVLADFHFLIRSRRNVNKMHYYFISLIVMSNAALVSLEQHSDSLTTRNISLAEENVAEARSVCLSRILQEQHYLVWWVLRRYLVLAGILSWSPLQYPSSDFDILCHYTWMPLLQRNNVSPKTPEILLEQVHPRNCKGLSSHTGLHHVLQFKRTKIRHPTTT